MSSQPPHKHVCSKSLISRNKSAFHISSISVTSSSSVTRNTHLSPRRRKWKFIPPPLNLASIEEERGLSEYDCGYLDLGTESPASASTLSLVDSSDFVERWAAASSTAPHISPRRSLYRRSSSPVTKNPSRFTKYAVDRDCGICFEYAVVPCRTLCCGKVFCTEHLADWLHGPKADGRCPNCENACALEGGTLSLASPPLLPSSQTTRGTLTQHFHSSPLTLVQHQPNDTPSTSSSTVDSSDTLSTEQSRDRHHVHHTFPTEGPLAISFSSPWGAASRLISIVLFLGFLYKLRS